MYSWRVSEGLTRSAAQWLVLVLKNRFLGMVQVSRGDLVCCANLTGFAPHIHVLYREVPFILNIIASSGAASSYESFR